MKKDILNVADVTPEQIETWKAKHGQVKEISVFTNTGIEKYIIGKPTHSVLDSIAAYSNDNKPQKVNEVLQNNCVLAGDTNLFTDPNVMNTVFSKVTEMLSKFQAEEKEL